MTIWTPRRSIIEPGQRGLALARANTAMGMGCGVPFVLPSGGGAPERIADIFTEGAISLYEASDQGVEGQVLNAIVDAGSLSIDANWYEIGGGVKAELYVDPVLNNALTINSAHYRCCYKQETVIGTDKRWSCFIIGDNRSTGTTWEHLMAGQPAIFLQRSTSKFAHTNVEFPAGTTPSGAFAYAIVGADTSMTLYGPSGPISTKTRQNAVYANSLNGASLFVSTGNSSPAKDFKMGVFAIVEGDASQDEEKRNAFFALAAAKYGVTA